MNRKIIGVTVGTTISPKLVANKAAKELHSSYGIVTDECGSTIILTDASHGELRALNIYGKTTQNGTPAPDAPVELETAGAVNGSITVSIGTSEEDEEFQALTVATPNGLPGVPVEADGNYLDENGQWWVCDEIDFVRGKYIKRIHEYTTHSGVTWNKNTTNYIGEKNIHLYLGFTSTSGRPILHKTLRGCLCNRLPYYKSAGKGNSELNVFRNLPGQSNIVLDLDKTVWPDVNAWDAWADENPLTFQYILETPVETDLTPELLAAYAELYTVKPVTVIRNDAEVGMTVSYIADTKNYIDNKVQTTGEWTDDECIDAFMVEANSKAASLGMSNSQFNVPSGLPHSVRGNNLSTAEDVMKLGIACFGNETLTEILAAKTYTFRTKGGSDREIKVNSLYRTGSTSNPSIPDKLGPKGYCLFGGKGGSLGKGSGSGQGDYGILNGFYMCSVGDRQAAVALMGNWYYDTAGTKQGMSATLIDVLDYLYALSSGQNPEDIVIGEKLNEVINRAEYPSSVAACLVPSGNMACWGLYSKKALLDERTSYSVRPEAQHVPASVTKLLTALVAVQNISDLEELVTIHQSDKVGGSGSELAAGEVMSIRDLLYLSLLESNNDATTAIARAVGEKFLERGTKIAYTTGEYTMKAGF